jgi:hypothetical protein
LAEGLGRKYFACVLLHVVVVLHQGNLMRLRSSIVFCVGLDRRRLHEP